MSTVTGLGALVGHGHQRRHRRRAARTRPVSAHRHLVAQPGELARRPQLVQRLRDPGLQLAGREVLGEVVERAQPDGLDGDGDLLHHREHDDADVGVALANLPQHLEAADARELDVEEHDVHLGTAQGQEPLLAGGGGDGFMPADRTMASMVWRMLGSSSTTSTVAVRMAAV
jgi:hypothetical protein